MCVELKILKSSIGGGEGGRSPLGGGEGGGAPSGGALTRGRSSGGLKRKTLCKFPHLAS